MGRSGDPPTDFSTCQDLLYQDVLSENVSTLDGVHERSFNVARTAEFCNETVIMPGQIFSYLNTIVVIPCPYSALS